MRTNHTWSKSKQHCPVRNGVTGCHRFRCPVRSTDGTGSTGTPMEHPWDQGERLPCRCHPSATWSRPGPRTSENGARIYRLFVGVMSHFLEYFGGCRCWNHKCINKAQHNLVLTGNSLIDRSIQPNSWPSGYTSSVWSASITVCRATSKAKPVSPNDSSSSSRRVAVEGWAEASAEAARLDGRCFGLRGRNDPLLPTTSRGVDEMQSGSG